MIVRSPLLAPFQCSSFSRYMNTTVHGHEVEDVFEPCASKGLQQQIVRWAKQLSRVTSRGRDEDVHGVNNLDNWNFSLVYSKSQE